VCWVLLSLGPEISYFLLFSVVLLLGVVLGCGPCFVGCGSDYQLRWGDLGDFDEKSST
jgi:hypothetical protein